MNIINNEHLNLISNHFKLKEIEKAITTTVSIVALPLFYGTFVTFLTLKDFFFSDKLHTKQTKETAKKTSNAAKRIFLNPPNSKKTEIPEWKSSMYEKLDTQLTEAGLEKGEAEENDDCLFEAVAKCLNDGTSKEDIKEKILAIFREEDPVENKEIIQQIANTFNINIVVHKISQEQMPFTNALKETFVSSKKANKPKTTLSPLNLGTHEMAVFSEVTNETITPKKGESTQTIYLANLSSSVKEHEWEHFIPVFKR